MEILRSGLSDQVQILGPTPKPITHIICSIIIDVWNIVSKKAWHRLNQILEFLQERGSQDLRVSDNEPQSLCKEEKKWQINFYGNAWFFSDGFKEDC